MPSAYTHLVFAQEIRNILHDTDIPSLPMYWIGTQGPDVFFFSHMGIMPGTLHKYGSLMHSKKVPETFSFLIFHKNLLVGGSHDPSGSVLLSQP